MSNLIASCHCLVTQPNGESRDSTIGVSQPTKITTGEYGCDVFLPDQEQPRTIYGEDSLQSLSLALKFMGDRIQDLFAKKWRFQYKAGSDAENIPFEAYFMGPVRTSIREESNEADNEVS